MKNLFVLFAILTSTAIGCKKKGGAGEAMAKTAEFKDQMCACKDKACADKVQADMSKWAADMAKSAGDKKPEAMSEEDTKKFTEVSTKLAECTQKAMGAGDTAAPPAGSAAAAEPPPAAVAPAGSAAAPTEGSAAPAAADAVVDLKDMQLQQPGEQDASNFATAKLWDDKSSNGEQYDLKISDVRNRPYMIKEFETPPAGSTKETVGTYPALVKEEMFGPELSVLVNKGGLVVSATTSRGAPKKDIEALKKAVQMMDLAGLEKNDLKKPEIDGKTLATYFPKLPAKK